MAVTARGIEVPNYRLPPQPPAERGLTGLGAFLAEATAGVALDLEAVRAAAEGAYSPFDLFAAGPSEHSQQMLDRIAARKAEYAEKEQKIPAKLLAEERVWRQKLAVARERERLEADRRAICSDCICLGFGGRKPREGLTIVTRDGRTLSDPACETYETLCPCPLGDAARARIERARRALLAADTARRLDRLWADLKIPEIPSGVTLDTHPDRTTVARLRRWYRGDYDKHGVILTGPNQRGKTTTAYLLARTAIEEGRGVLAVTVPDLLERLTDTFHHDETLRGNPDHPTQTTHADLIRSVQEVELLLLDDLGAEKMSDYVARALFQILNARADANAWTIITTNLEPRELGARLGQRLWARITKLCARVVFDGPMLGPARGGLVDLEDLE